MSHTAIEAVLDDFWRARQDGVYFPPAYNGELTFDDAYRIQLGLIARREAAGERQVGWKVGLTAKTIQDQFRVHEPVFGCLLAEGVKGNGAVFACGELIKPGFENEICMRLGRDLTDPHIDAATARRAIESCHPAFEITETRGDFTAELALAIADNVQQKAIVLGPATRMSGDLDLAAIGVRVEINGEEVAAGKGDAVLGDPVNSVVWLAKKLAQFGRGLKAGDLVMTGSFTRQFLLHPGDRIRARFDRLGEVAAEFR
ncbi:MAG TPA: fumarylacetoacetate hydrolase family protein [Alphaproteobacteria bacterium]|nr:fumarylacetoacetate hydrolase family protein [Alphaproteobacteria bacterium]